MQTTTVKLHEDTKHTLEKMKMFERETYNEIIERMIEDNLELNVKTKQEIEAARKRIKSGKFLTQEQVEKRLGL